VVVGCEAWWELGSAASLVAPIWVIAGPGTEQRCKGFGGGFLQHVAKANQLLVSTVPQ